MSRCGGTPLGSRSLFEPAENLVGQILLRELWRAGHKIPAQIDDTERSSDRHGPPESRGQLGGDDVSDGCDTDVDDRAGVQRFSPVYSGWRNCDKRDIVSRCAVGDGISAWAAHVQPVLMCMEYIHNPTLHPIHLWQ